MTNILTQIVKFCAQIFIVALNFLNFFVNSLIKAIKLLVEVKNAVTQEGDKIRRQRMSILVFRADLLDVLRLRVMAVIVVCLSLFAGNYISDVLILMLRLF